LIGSNQYEITWVLVKAVIVSFYSYMQLFFSQYIFAGVFDRFCS